MNTEELRKVAEAATPGPWRWEINRGAKILHLVGGRPMYDLTVMDFDRWGMNRATVSLRDLAHDGMNLLHKLHERDDWIQPFPDRDHHSDWCANVVHPDTAHIAAFNPKTAIALLERIAALEAENAELRKIVSGCLAALGTTAGCSPECSMEFMKGVPGEIAGTVAGFKAQAYRFHDIMQKHGLHPGRTDDDLLEILDAALKETP